MLAVGPMRNATRTRWEEGAAGRIGAGPIIMLRAPYYVMCRRESPHSPQAWLGWAGSLIN